jgi:hypothetical protein
LSCWGLAEAAAVTYQSFILRYPLVATYNACESRGADGTCNDAGKIASWANANGISTSGSSGNCTVGSKPLSPSDFSRISETAKAQWQEIIPGAPSQGQYRLVDYQYQSDPGKNQHEAPGVGTLSVEVKFFPPNLQMQAIQPKSRRRLLSLG